MTELAQRPSVHVRPGEHGDWTVQSDESDDPASVHADAGTAERSAERYARTCGAELVVVHDCYSNLHVTVVAAKSRSSRGLIESRVEGEAGPAATVLARERFYADPRLARRGNAPSRQTESTVGPVPFPEHAMSSAEIGPTITAMFTDGPLAGRSIEAEVLEGRPPKTLDASAEDGSTLRYCLEGWVQSGRSAEYTFLYRV